VHNEVDGDWNHGHRPPLAARQQYSSKGEAVHSGGHRGFTVVTIITLVFAPIFAHNHWMWKLVGKTKDVQIVQCIATQPCPSHTRTVNVVTLPGAPTPSPKGLKDKSKGSDGGDAGAIVVDDPNSVTVDGNDEPAAPKQH
jgi:hypothetical protein